MGTFIALSPYKRIDALVLEDGTRIETHRNVMQAEYVPSQVFTQGGHFLITIAMTPNDFKKLIKDNGDENPE